MMTKTERRVERMGRKKLSLRQGVLAVIVICWLVPLIIVVALAGALLENSYHSSAQQAIDTSLENALVQVQSHLETGIRDSKTVSYDGIVRSAYRSYQQNGDSAALYRSVSDYLSQEFSRELMYRMVFISFWDPEIGADAYHTGSGTTGFELLKQCQIQTPRILEEMAGADTLIRFLVLDDQLYMARNLVDSNFQPYASVVMLLDGGSVFRPLEGISRVRDMHLALDGCCFELGEEGKIRVCPAVDMENRTFFLETEVDGHRMAFTADLIPYDIWSENPWMYWAVAGMALLVIPLMCLSIGLFTHHITRPIETLAQANRLVQSGQRGYEIDQQPPNREFGKLYDHFNGMSTELQHQFTQAYLEQQAAQKAQIKALQSQINPHFLNNTLEIINWEARLAENDRVCAMIEALSTMLDAALDRDGRTQISLKEELGYVDAYLYIIRERLGDKFHVHKEIDRSLLLQKIPRLILQPIVENAVEHDITRRRGGNLWVRVRREEKTMVLEVEHDGTMTDADRENICQILSEPDGEIGRVGLRNVHQRLRLIYGPAGVITVGETLTGTILATVRFPVE